MQRAPWCGSVAIIAAACVGEPPPALLEHLRLEVELRIADEADPRYRFTTIARLAANESSVVVHQRGEQELRVFSVDGRHRRNIGRAGSGPGEFRELEAIGLLGDTLWTIDGGLRRITLFRLDGSVITTISFASIPEPTGADYNRFYPYPRALTRNGHVLADGGWYASDIASGATRNKPLLRISRAGETQDTLGWVAIGNAPMIMRTERRTMYYVQPFSDAPITEYAATAGQIVVVEQGDPADPTLAAVRVTAIRVTGDTAWSTLVPYAPVPLPRSRVDSVRTSLVRAFGATFPAAVIDEALYVPAYRAPIAHAVVAEDGTLWLRWDRHTRPNVYSVLDPTGRLFAEVAVPPGVRLRWISGDTAWGEQLDEDDVPALVRLRLTKGGRSD